MQAETLNQSDMTIIRIACRQVASFASELAAVRVPPPPSTLPGILLRSSQAFAHVLLWALLLWFGQEGAPVGSQQLYEIKQALEALEAKVSERAHSPFQHTHPTLSCIPFTQTRPTTCRWLAGCMVGRSAACSR